MNWEAIGAIGEIMGATVVVITLIYLAAQMKQNTLALRSSHLEDWAASDSSISDFRAQHADVLAKAYSGDSLTRSESIVVNAFCLKLFRAMEVVFLHYHDGALTQSVYESRIVGLMAAFTNPVILAEWNVSKGWGFSPEFVEMVDNKIRDGQQKSDVAVTAPG
jgi:hypothetical protein